MTHEVETVLFPSMKKQHCFQSILFFCGISLFFLGCSNTVTRVVPEIIPHMGHRVLLLSAKAPSSLPLALWNQVEPLVQSRLGSFKSFASMMLESEADGALQQNTELLSQKQAYTTSLALAGISDRDISTQLSRSLSVDQVLLLFLDQYTCTVECSVEKQFVIYMLLVDALTGQEIWTGHLHYEVSHEEADPGQFPVVVTKLSNELMDALMDDLTIPWNQYRYQGLRRLRKGSSLP